MWCTRWFLPLVILPLPTAPPYFLAVLLVSLYLHTRPCFYCMMLVAALFTSSCYWQALPIDTQLSRPIGNATTFGEALRANASTPALASIGLPPAVQLLDRCWCSVFSNGLFEPSDVSEWELASVVQMRKTLDMQVHKEEEKEGEDDIVGGVAPAGTADAILESKASIPEAIQDSNTQDSPASSSFSFRGLRDLFFPELMTPSSKYRLKPASSPTTSSASLSVPVTPPELSPAPSIAVEPKQDSIRSNTKSNTREDPHSTSGVPVKLLRRYYDLKPYGLDVTIDFSWNR